MSDFDNYKKAFVKKATQNGYSAENIEKCLVYSKSLLDKNLPVIYNSSHFSSLVGYDVKYIKRAILSTKYFYRYFEIIKKSGKSRPIAEPLPSLKEIQVWILNEILYKVKVSRYAKGFIPNRSLIEHLKYHKNEKTVLTLDIENFFGNISDTHIIKVFLDLGYSKSMTKILSELCLLEKKLPQGAPTSPYLTNIVMIDFDYQISIYCKDNKIKYTRYADDLAFSGDFDSKELINIVNKELNKLKLKINKDKTLLMKQNVQQIISGIVVNKKTQVPKNIRNKIRTEMYYIKKFGLDEHLKRIENNRENYTLHLIGRINYLLNINPSDEEFKNYKQFLYTIP